jgi:hypothetical protein
MTAEQTESLIKLMAKLGVTHLKTPLFEAHLALQKAPQSIASLDSIPSSSLDTKQSIVEPFVGTPSPVKEASLDAPIPHTQEELASLMKLSDQELLDRLIPDTTSQEE